MSDQLGYFCEALVYSALSKSQFDWAFHDTSKPATLVNCLDKCAYGQQCRKEGRKPLLRVESDFVIYKKGPPIFIYVTHAESPNIYNFKLWRTLAEVVEHRRYIDGAYCVDLLLGPLREKQEVKRGFQIISDIQLHLGLSDHFIKCKDVFLADYSGNLTVEDISRWIEEQKRGSFLRLIDEVKSSLEENIGPLKTKSSHGSIEPFREICRAADWSDKTLPVSASGFIRTGVILGTFGLDLIGRGDTKFLTSAIEGKNFPKNTDIPNLPYRKRGDDLLWAWTADANAAGTRVSFAPEIISARAHFKTSQEFIDFLLLYRDRVSADPTWSKYLALIVQTSNRLQLIDSFLKCWASPDNLGKTIRQSVSGHGMPGAIDLIASFFGLSMNKLAQYLSDLISNDKNIEMKKFAPHGDGAMQVLSYLNRGDIDQLNFKVMPKEQFLGWLICSLTDLWKELTENAACPKQDEVDALFSYRLVKTFLTRAPSPLEASIEEMCHKILTPAGFRPTKNPSVTPTFINDLIGGKILRAGVAFGYEKVGKGTLEFLISSTSEGNDKHKQKEYAAKIVAKKLQAQIKNQEVTYIVRPNTRVVAVLDGTWPGSAQDYLYKMGCDLVVTFGNALVLRNYLNSIAK